MSRDDSDLVPVPGQVESFDPYRPAEKSLRLVLSGISLVVAGLLLFVHLGAYGLWGDEADTVLFAQGVWDTGDTSAIVGNNLYAYRNGALLTDLKNRQTPPLAYFALAPIVGTLGSDPLVARALFALCGLSVVSLAVAWLWKARASPIQWLTLMATGLTSVSFFLYSRQCRYYALASLATLAVVYCYLHHRGRWLTLVGLLVSSLMLLTSQYLNFAALVAVLAADYFVWQRHTFTWSRKDAAIVMSPLLVIGGLLWWYWSGGSASGNGIVGRLTLLWWNLRDLNACEMVSGLMLFGSPLVWLFTHDRWLLRLPLAVLVYSLAVATLSPQAVAASQVADVRYLAPLVLAGIALAARWLYWLCVYGQWKALPVVVLVVGTNVLYVMFALLIAPPGGWSAAVTELGRTLRATPVDYVREIIVPRETASRMVSDWIREHVPAGSSVWVVPGEEMYPLMVQAPQAVYAWQLNAPVAEPFRELPKIHTFGKQPIDTIVVYGPFVAQANFITLLDALKTAGHEYRRVATLDQFWDDAIRPELFWRRFHPLTHFDRATQAIYIYQRTQP